VAVTAAFGKAAYKMAGDEAKRYGDKAKEDCARGTPGACEDVKRWGEGGRYRVALHTLIGALGHGQAGAIANLTASSAAPHIVQLAKDAGFAEGTLAHEVLVAAASAAVGAGVGGRAGAAAAFNADANNRQLHVDQTDQVKRRARQLHGIDGKSAAQWEIELTQQLLRQNDRAYAGFSENAAARAVLADLQRTTGVSMSTEGTAAFDNAAINADQLARNASSYMAAGNLPGSSVKYDLLTFAYVQAVSTPDFAALSHEKQREVLGQLIVHSEAQNESKHASAIQKRAADQAARTAAAWVRQTGAMPANMALIPAERRQGQSYIENVLGAAIASASAKKRSDPVLGSAAERVYSSSRPLEEAFPELAGVNPHYVADAGIGVNTNCVSCVNAVDARLKGANPSAVAGPSIGYKGPNDLLPSIPLGFHKETYTVETIVQEISRDGHGARGVVMIKQPNGVDHVINVVNKNGTVFFIDGQLGRVVTLQPNLTVRLGRP
jgi:hypothetical protein